jgi:hypothetical protein
MNIYETIPKIMEAVGAVTKDKKNTSGQAFMYRGIDDVMNALNPAMTKFKLFVVPEVLEQLREDRTSKQGTPLIYSVCKIKYTFYAEDGSNVAATVIGEAFDSGDKATNKAMSIAFKYACFQVFCIPTEEMKDPDSESHELSKAQNNMKVELVTELEANTIKALCEKRGLDVAVVFNGVPVEQLTKEQYVVALKKLNPIQK